MAKAEQGVVATKRQDEEHLPRLPKRPLGIVGMARMFFSIRKFLRTHSDCSVCLRRVDSVVELGVSIKEERIVEEWRE
jgi:hypothetical protein